MITGARVARRVAVRRSEEIPAAYDADEPGGGRGDHDRRRPICPSRVCGIGSGPSHREVRTGSDARAESVNGPTKRVAPRVMTGLTKAPASTSRRHTSTAL